jgi:hypothetical protein
MHAIGLWLEPIFGADYARKLTPSRRTRTLAWALGLLGAVACVAGAGVALAFRAPVTFQVVYLVGILMGLLGALIASRESRNSIGWLMCATSLATGLFHLPTGYGYFALVIEHGSWPLGSVAVWLGTWGWVLPLGLSLPMIAVRFPDGRVPDRWRAVDVLAITGTALFAVSIALIQQPATLVDFTPVPGVVAERLSPLIHNPIGISIPLSLLRQAQGAGLTLMVLGYVAAAASLVGRFQHARGDESLQLKWFAYSGVLIAVTLVYAGVAWNLFGQPLYLALTPLILAYSTVPVAVGIAILRYRLYDIDLLINRTIVYAGATAILGALYAAVVTFVQRLFISTSGQKSDAAYVLTAFVVVVAFGPVKDWLQRQVDRRLRRVDATALLDQFREDVDAVVSVMDEHRVACRLVDEAVLAFDAHGAALYLKPASNPVYSRGPVNGAGVEVMLVHEGRQLGRLVLGSRRGGVSYSTHDRDALQRSADSVSEALALAEHLGHRPLPNQHVGKEE